MSIIDATTGRTAAVRPDNLADIANKIEQTSGKTLHGQSVSIEQFENALVNAEKLNGTSPAQGVQAGQQNLQVAQLNSQNATTSATSVQGVNPVAKTNGAAKNRALRGLDLDKAAVHAKPGGDTGDFHSGWIKPPARYV